MYITFTVPGVPRPLKRHRISVIGGHARAYDPDENVANKAAVAYAARAAMGDTILTGPLAVDLEFILPRPKARTPKRLDRMSEEQLLRYSWPDTKPDLDNMEKLVFDALNGVVWRDDSQVCLVVKGKYYGPVPMTRVTVRAIHAGEMTPDERTKINQL